MFKVYDENFSSVVVKMNSIWVLGMETTLNLEVEQLDVNTLFLHGDLKVDVHMEQVESFEVKDKRSKAYKLVKSFCG